MRNRFECGLALGRVAIAGGLAVAVVWAAGTTRAAAGGLAQEGGADRPALAEAEAKALKNPYPYATASINRGKLVYGSLGCNACHGNDGRALIEVVANATDLTNPSVWKNGVEEGLIFRSIRDGAGLSMPGFKTQVDRQEDIWHLVNFIRSLWPEALRPQRAAAP